MSTTTTTAETTTPNSNSPVSTFLPEKSNVKVLSQDSKGDLYLKVFLLGGDKNGNKWGIDPSTVEQNIKTAIGKPLVIYKDTGEEPDRLRMTPYGPVGSWTRRKGMYNHPPWDEHSIEHSREMLKPFTVGEIHNYAKNQKTGDYWGIVKITNDDLKTVFRENPNIPFYVSPQLWRLNKAETHNLKTWEFTHLAIVSMPAFGQRATVQGSCDGDVETCVSRFANASLNLPTDESGAPKSCGFCIKNAMKEVAEQTIENEKVGRTIDDIRTEDTSHLTNSTNLKTEERLSDNSNTQSNVGAGVPNAATLSENVAPERTNAQSITVEHKTYPNPETHTYRPNANNNAKENTTAPSADKLALIARIEQEKAKRQEALQQLKVLARDNQKLATEANKHERELAEVRSYMEAQKAAAREDGIAQVVYNANLADLIPEDKKEAAIKLALSKGLDPKEIALIVSPIYEAFDSFVASQKQNGNYNNPSEQVPQFNTPTVTSPANASLNSRRESRLKLGASNNSGNAYNASQNKPVSTFSELAFERARKLAGMYTPNDNSEVV